MRSIATKTTRQGGVGPSHWMSQVASCGVAVASVHLRWTAARAEPGQLVLSGPVIPIGHRPTAGACDVPNKFACASAVEFFVEVEGCASARPVSNESRSLPCRSCTSPEVPVAVKARVFRAERLFVWARA